VSRGSNLKVPKLLPHSSKIQPKLHRTPPLSEHQQTLLSQGKTRKSLERQPDFQSTSIQYPTVQRGLPRMPPPPHIKPENVLKVSFIIMHELVIVTFLLTI
jgi:hypothetical protein